MLLCWTTVIIDCLKRAQLSLGILILHFPIKSFILDPLSLVPRGVLVEEYLESERNKENARNSNIADDAVTSGNLNDKLMVKWNQHHIIWLNPYTLNKFRDEAYQKIELEVL